jgi:hypothetical protein
VPLIDELVDMPSEESLHLITLQQSEEPGPGGLINIVIITRLPRLQYIKRIMAEHMDPPSPPRLEITLKPSRLLNLRGEPRVQDRGVDKHKVDPAMIERLEEGTKPLRILIETVLIDQISGHSRVIFITHIMVPRQKIDRRPTTPHDPKSRLSSRTIGR